LNTDSTYYGGGDVGNAGAIEAEEIGAHGHGASLSLTLPPLGVIILQPAGRLS
jgi:1,4-alpha-glucan branching enzyme